MTAQTPPPPANIGADSPSAREKALREALRMVLPLAENWADGKSRSHPDHECVEAARAALANGGSNA